jgi:hypothetical protein
MQCSPARCHSCNQSAHLLAMGVRHNKPHTGKGKEGWNTAPSRGVQQQLKCRVAHTRRPVPNSSPTAN